MKTAWSFLISLKTVFGFFALSIAICAVGSIVLPTNLVFFSGIDDAPLFKWLQWEGNLPLTWWVYALIGSLALLALSTLACTTDALIGVGSRNLVFKLSAHVMHLGVLLVMLAHLLTAAFGVREDFHILKGEGVKLDDKGIAVQVLDVRSSMDADGYYTDWEVELELTRGDSNPVVRILKPVKPIRFGGLNLFFKTISVGDEETTATALIRVTRDPGVLWALLGGILVTLGGIGFVWSRRQIN